MTTHRVTCPDYTRQFATLTAAEDWQTTIESAGNCHQAHTVETQDGDEWIPVHTATARRVLKLKVRDEIDTGNGILIVAGRRWPAGADQNPEAQAALAFADFPAYTAALGAPESVRLTTDGRDQRTDGWCQCTPQPDGGTWVRYERWTTEGRVAHGYLCPTCRFVTQTG